jgi:hypothetical protein
MLAVIMAKTECAARLFAGRRRKLDDREGRETGPLSKHAAASLNMTSCNSIERLFERVREVDLVKKPERVCPN